MNTKKNKGFSLVELSIVIAIIGLIVGGVMTGKHILRSGEVQAVIAQSNEYKAAMRQFELLYDGLPGDLRNADSFWTGATNGNGNRQIEGEPSDEAFLFFDHLVRAELTGGSYLGIWSNGFVSGQRSGNNVAATKMKGGSIYVRCCSTTDYARDIDFNNFVNIFSVYADDDDYRDGLITPIEALSIDRKTDDGNPDAGLIGASSGYNGSGYLATGCYTNTGANAKYASDNDNLKNEPVCQMMFAYDWD